jgi:hypothetical protein
MHDPFNDPSATEGLMWAIALAAFNGSFLTFFGIPIVWFSLWLINKLIELLVRGIFRKPRPWAQSLTTVPTEK